MENAPPTTLLRHPAELPVCPAQWMPGTTGATQPRWPRDVVVRSHGRKQYLFERIPNRRNLLQDPNPVGISEGPFVDVVKSAPTARRLFVERYSTVLSPLKKWHDGTMDYPRIWFWINGRLTNDRDHEREFLYLRRSIGSVPHSKDFL